MLKRDRRWCQGNMQHIWLLFAKKWHPMSRLNFLHGILSYASSLLWLLFLVFSTALAALPSGRELERTQTAEQLLLGLTIALIFLPKTVILLDEQLTGRMFKPLKQRFLTSFSSVLDTIIFTLMAPVLMIFHARFVVYTLLGKGVNWVAQRRKMSGGVDWVEVFFTFGPISLLGIVWGVVGWFISTNFLLWISPILICLVLSIPMAGIVSGSHSGRRLGLFLSPEEDEPPTVLSTMEQNLTEVNDRLQLQPELEKYFGLLQVCLDPYVNGLHVSLLRKNIQVSRDYLDTLADRLVREGPQALKPQEIKAMIYDTDTMTHLHYRLWSAADKDLAPFWFLAIRQYNVAATNPFAHLLAQRKGETVRLSA
jgi:membrane glycosyltransferase